MSCLAATLREHERKKKCLTGSEQLKTVAATHVACACFTLPGLQHKKYFLLLCHVL